MNDLTGIAAVALICFPDDYGSLELATAWHRAGLAADPKTQYFVASQPPGEIRGFASWSFVGGFKSGVVELEQLGVHPNVRGRGIGTRLITETLPVVRAFLQERIGRDFHLIKVDTGANNRAQDLYRQTLGAQVEATFKDFLYGQDEVVMFKRFAGRS